MEKIIDPDYNLDEDIPKKVLSVMKKQQESTGNAVQGWMSSDPPPSNVNGHWCFVALIPIDVDT